MIADKEYCIKPLQGTALSIILCNLPDGRGELASPIHLFPLLALSQQHRTPSTEFLLSFDSAEFPSFVIRSGPLTGSRAKLTRRVITG